MILLIDNYDSFTYNIFQAVAGLGQQVMVRRNDAIGLKEIRQLNPTAIILSPGPGRPEGAGICIDLIKAFSGKIPILGICLGHQAIAKAFGGGVVSAGEIVHGRADDITHHGTGLFKGLAAPFAAGRYHSLVAEKETLPDEFQVEAATKAGMIMAIRHKDHPTFGIQFHPESILTPKGPKLLENFLEIAGSG